VVLTEGENYNYVVVSPHHQIWCGCVFSAFTPPEERGAPYIWGGISQQVCGERRGVIIHGG